MKSILAVFVLVTAPTVNAGQSSQGAADVQLSASVSNLDVCLAALLEKFQAEVKKTTSSEEQLHLCISNMKELAGTVEKVAVEAKTNNASAGVKRMVRAGLRPSVTMLRGLRTNLLSGRELKGKDAELLAEFDASLQKLQTDTEEPARREPEKSRQ